MANSLSGIDLVRCWVAWRILPLSRRPYLMCAYTGDVKDPQCHYEIEMDDDSINKMTKSLLNESLDSCSKIGLNPFCTLNKAPIVSTLKNLPLIHYINCLLIIAGSLWANSSFWHKKLQDKLAKKVWTKKGSQKACQEEDRHS